MFKDAVWGFGVLGSCGSDYAAGLQQQLAPLWEESKCRCWPMSRPPVTNLKCDALAAELAALQTEAAAPDFWQTATDPQAVMQQIAKLKRTAPWLSLRQSATDLKELSRWGLVHAGRAQSANSRFDHAVWSP